MHSLRYSSSDLLFPWTGGEAPMRRGARCPGQGQGARGRFTCVHVHLCFDSAPHMRAACANLAHALATVFLIHQMRIAVQKCMPAEDCVLQTA